MLCFHLEMFIGYSQRRQTILEGDREHFNISPMISVMRFSELDIPITISLDDNSINTADIEGYLYGITSILTDALFGPVEYHILQAGTLGLGSVIITIVSNFHPEETLKCFTLRISSQNTRHFRCNEDNSNPSDYFCLHTICIMDNDGRLLLMLSKNYDIVNFPD